MRRIAAAVLAALVLAPVGHSGVTLGLKGDPDRFQRLTGQRTVAEHIFLPWDVGPGRLDMAFERNGPKPLIAINPALKPRAVARGYGDAFLIRLNHAAERSGKPAYIRPMPEMNGHWSPYCAYNQNGTRRGRAYSQAWFKKAFRRIYVIVKGGAREEMNERLARFGMPPVAVDLPVNSQLRVIWNPQGFGSPNVPGNMPAAYWPGRGFVDVVGNDLYDVSGRAMWQAAHDLYRRYPGKPYAFGEWGLWGIDDPGFIRRMRRFVVRHERIELLAWYNGRAGQIWDLASKPASRRAYRRLIVPLAG
jgi:hypothetical protein